MKCISDTLKLIFSFLLFWGCNQLKNQNDLIICGIYGDPNAFWNKGISLDESGVNAIFVHSGSIKKQMMERALKEGLKVYAEFPTLNGKDYVGNISLSME